MSDLGGLTSNKPTYHLLGYGDLTLAIGSFKIRKQFSSPFCQILSIISAKGFQMPSSSGGFIVAVSQNHRILVMNLNSYSCVVCNMWRLNHIPCTSSTLMAQYNSARHQPNHNTHPTIVFFVCNCFSTIFSGYFLKVLVGSRMVASVLPLRLSLVAETLCLRITHIKSLSSTLSKYLYLRI